ncbi:hypothetical protein AMR41_26320 [Hapalosiphon sp. MRB220]|nr:hypothetical protein AMR41_26320 [Hapalosiphon sp. MRB220]
MAKYILGKFEFKNWGEVQNLARKILSGGCREITGDEFDFAMDLFSYHVSADEKLKNGVKSIRVNVSEYDSHYCFWIKDDNDFEQDISYKRCIPLSKKNPEKAKSSNLKNEIINAYRHCVVNDINRFKNNQDLICYRCKSKENIVVDHITPIVKLINDFEQENNIKKFPALKRHKESLYTFKFSTDNDEDRIFVERWITYHQKKAKFQLLCNKCNLRKSSSGIRYSQNF